MNRVVPPTMIHVKPQKDVARSSKPVDEVESRANEGQSAKKVGKSKGKAKAGPEDFRDDDVDIRTAEKTGRAKETKGGDARGKKAAEKRGAVGGSKPSRGRTGADVARHVKNDPPVPKGAKGTAQKVPFVLLIKRNASLQTRTQGKPKKSTGGEKTAPGGSRRGYKSRSVVESSAELSDADASGDTDDDGRAGTATRATRYQGDDDQPDEDEEGCIAARLPC